MKKFNYESLYNQKLYAYFERKKNQYSVIHLVKSTRSNFMLLVHSKSLCFLLCLFHLRLAFTIFKKG